MAQKLKIAAIRIDGGTQPRAALNQATVDDYSEVLTAGGELPPVTVFHDGANHWLADGFHRLFAHRKIGALTLVADIRQGTLRDAILHAVGANAAHGLRRTNEDKRKAVLTLLQDAEWGKWSDREIARRCEVGHPLVATLRATVTGRNSSEDRKYQTKHGTTATMDVVSVSEANKKRKKPGKETVASDATDAGAGFDSTVTTPPAEPSAAQATMNTAGISEFTREHAEPRNKSQDGLGSASEMAELRELLAEQTAMLEEAQGEIESLSRLVDAGDQLAEARRQIHQLQAEVRVLRERQAGLMNEAAEAKRLARAWRMKLERIEKAGA